MAKITVTGGAGFIGSNLVDRLMNEGNEVTVIDSMAGGQESFIKHHFSSPKFKFIKLDLRETDKLIQAFDPKTELVYHLAANSDISKGIEDPSVDFNHTITATFSLLQALKHHGIKKLVYTSGSGVYGDLGAKFLAETYGPLKPVSMYGGAKLAAEGIISAFAHFYDMQVWILRPANIIGPRSTHGVIYDFIKRLKTDPTQLRILGDGKQSKAYLFVTDVLDALQLVQKDKSSRVNIFNLSSSSFITVNQIADLVIKGLKLKNVKITRTGGSVGWKGDVAVIRLRNTEITKLGWKAKYTSYQAAKATIEALVHDESLMER